MSVIGGLAGLAALIKVFIDARNARPNIAEAYERMATKQAEQIENLRGRVARLEEELRETDIYVDELLSGITTLVGQLCEANVKPRYTPRSRKVETQQIP